MFCSLFKKDPHYANESTENQKPKNQAMINTQSTLSMKTKIKNKPIKSFQMQKKMIFQTNKQMRKTKYSTFNQSLVLN